MLRDFKKLFSKKNPKKSLNDRKKLFKLYSKYFFLYRDGKPIKFCSFEIRIFLHVGLYFLLYFLDRKEDREKGEKKSISFQKENFFEVEDFDFSSEKHLLVKNLFRNDFFLTSWKTRFSKTLIVNTNEIFWRNEKNLKFFCSWKFLVVMMDSLFFFRRIFYFFSIFHFSKKRQLFLGYFSYHCPANGVFTFQKFKSLEFSTNYFFLLISSEEKLTEKWKVNDFFPSFFLF